MKAGKRKREIKENGDVREGIVEQWVSVLKTASVGAQGRGQEAADAGAHGREHWRPQFVAACDSSTTRRVVTHLPVEMLGDGLEAFANTHGIAGLRDPSRTNISSRHYVKHTKRMLPNASHVPYTELETAIPSYSSFFTDPAIARDVCCLFANDVHMYRAACREPWVSACESCAAACKRELSRMEVCDLAPAGQTQALVATCGMRARNGHRNSGGRGARGKKETPERARKLARKSTTRRLPSTQADTAG